MKYLESLRHVCAITTNIMLITYILCIAVLCIFILMVPSVNLMQWADVPVAITSAVCAGITLRNTHHEYFYNWGELTLATPIEKLAAIIAVGTNFATLGFLAYCDHVLQCYTIPYMGLVMMSIGIIEAIACIWFCIIIFKTIILQKGAHKQ